MGGVIRDHTRKVLWSLADLVKHCNYAEEAEANALLKCLNFWDDQDIQIDVVETDCAAVWSSIQAGRQDLSSFCYV